VDVTAMDQTGTNNTIQNTSSENKASGNSDANGETRRGNFSPFIFYFGTLLKLRSFTGEAKKRSRLQKWFEEG
jgi:hypothetical protein